MMTYEQIKELIQLVSQHRLQGVEIERAGFRIKISGGLAAQSPELPAARVESIVPASTPIAPPGPAGEAPAPEAAHEARAQGLHVVTSPIVGTFYAAPNPESDPFVRPGDRIRKGQVLCIVEAMKLMNEIESDADGVVVEIYPKNAQPIEFGEPLFGVRAD